MPGQGEGRSEAGRIDLADTAASQGMTRELASNTTMREAGTDPPPGPQGGQLCPHLQFGTSGLRNYEGPVPPGLRCSVGSPRRLIKGRSREEDYFEKGTKRDGSRWQDPECVFQL